MLYENTGAHCQATPLHKHPRIAELVLVNTSVNRSGVYSNRRSSCLQLRRVWFRRLRHGRAHAALLYQSKLDSRMLAKQCRLQLPKLHLLPGPDSPTTRCECLRLHSGTCLYINVVQELLSLRPFGMHVFCYCVPASKRLHDNELAETITHARVILCCNTIQLCTMQQRAEADKNVRSRSSEAGVRHFCMGLYTSNRHCIWSISEMST